MILNFLLSLEKIVQSYNRENLGHFLRKLIASFKRGDVFIQHECMHAYARCLLQTGFAKH